MDSRGEDIGLFNHLQFLRRQIVLGLIQNVGDTQHRKPYLRMAFQVCFTVTFLL